MKTKERQKEINTMANRNLNNVVLNGRITADAVVNANGTIA